MQEKIREIEEGKFKLGFWITELLNFQSLTNANYERMIPKSTQPININYYISCPNRKLLK